MLGISFPELIVILLALFLIVGPKRMVEVSNDLGKWVRRLKIQLYHIKQTHLSDIDTSSFYEAKTALNQSLSEIENETKKQS